MSELKIHYLPTVNSSRLLCGTGSPSRLYTTDPTEVTCRNCERLMVPALDKLMVAVMTVKPRAKFYKPRKPKTGSRVSSRHTLKARKHRALVNNYHHKLYVKVSH